MSDRFSLSRWVWRTCLVSCIYYLAYCLRGTYWIWREGRGNTDGDTQNEWLTKRKERKTVPVVPTLYKVIVSFIRTSCTYSVMRCYRTRQEMDRFWCLVDAISDGRLTCRHCSLPCLSSVASSFFWEMWHATVISDAPPDINRIPQPNTQSTRYQTGKGRFPNRNAAKRPRWYQSWVLINILVVKNCQLLGRIFLTWSISAFFFF